MAIVCANFEVRSICGDWYDGKHSAMYRAYRGQKFSPKTLLDETREALDNLAFEGEKRKREEESLRKVENFAEHHTEVEAAKRAIVRVAQQARRARIDWETFKTIAGYYM